MSLQCPKCQGPSKIIDSRPNADNSGTRRRRECIRKKCAYRWSTFEMSAEAYDALIAGVRAFHDALKPLAAAIRLSRGKL